MVTILINIRPHMLILAKLSWARILEKYLNLHQQPRPNYLRRQTRPKKCPNSYTHCQLECSKLYVVVHFKTSVSQYKYDILCNYAVLSADLHKDVSVQCELQATKANWHATTRTRTGKTRHASRQNGCYVWLA